MVSLTTQQLSTVNMSVAETVCKDELKEFCGRLSNERSVQGELVSFFCVTIVFFVLVGSLFCFLPFSFFFVASLLPVFLLFPLALLLPPSSPWVLSLFPFLSLCVPPFSGHSCTGLS